MKMYIFWINCIINFMVFVYLYVIFEFRLMVVYFEVVI